MTNRFPHPFGTLLALALGIILAASGCARAPIQIPATLPGLSRLEPASGAYFGVNLDWAMDSPAAFNKRLQHHAAVHVRFFQIPLTDSDLAAFDSTVSAVADQHGMLMVTLEPVNGLSAVTPDASAVLAGRLARANSMGVATFVRFAHEMNGSWYPWSQQPMEYVEAFRSLAQVVHSRAPRSAMVWAPSYGGGYPFAGGQFEAHPGSPDFALLDTDHDGRLDMTDDPYAPYYPGDDAVDWVGMSLYHWGSRYPWGGNDIPEAGKFAAQLQGQYNGLIGDDSALPDFYATFAVGHRKPLAITETAAFYNPARPGPDELTLKQAWWHQVLDPAFLAGHPQIKMINWFEWLKPESEVGGAVIDWRVLGTPGVAEKFRLDLPLNRLIFAP